MAKQDRIKQARRRLAEIKGFFIHFAIFLIVMTILFTVNYTNAGPWWVQWPFIGWGAGILLHWALVFSPLRRWGSDWEKRKLEELMRED